MKAVWKLGLRLVDLQNIEVPRGAQVLAFRNQRETPCIWFLCDPSEPVTRLGALRIIGTGHETKLFDDPGWRYIGTDLFEDGRLVFHAFLLERAE